MSKGLHHITEYLLNNYLGEVERQLEEGSEERVIIHIPIAIESENGKYNRIILPSNQNIIDCVNEDFEDNIDVEFTTWEVEK